jgi:SnoaL-like domain
MPWAPELFSFPTVEAIKEKRRRDQLRTVSFFDGLLSGEMDALVGSFAGEPELHHPIRGRVKGDRALEHFVTYTRDWFAEQSVAVEDVNLLLTPARGVEEVVLHFESDDGPVALPMAAAAEHAPNDRITELRVYYSTWPLYGRHAVRPPVLQPDPRLYEPDVVGEYQRALAAGDAEAAVAAFEPDGYVREPAGPDYIHRGTDELRALYGRFFSNDGGIPLEHCAVTDDGSAVALEYNVVRWGGTALPPQAGVAVYVRGESGNLAAARIYDDADPPLERAV